MIGRGVLIIREHYVIFTNDSTLLMPSIESEMGGQLFCSLFQLSARLAEIQTMLAVPFRRCVYHYPRGLLYIQSFFEILIHNYPSSYSSSYRRTILKIYK